MNAYSITMLSDLLSCSPPCGSLWPPTTFQVSYSQTDSLVLRVSLKRRRFSGNNGFLHLQPKWTISHFNYTWDGRLRSRPEGRPVIWPSMNRDPTKWPSYDGYSLETSLHPSSPSFLLFLPFHFTFSFLSWIFVFRRTKLQWKGFFTVPLHIWSWHNSVS